MNITSRRNFYIIGFLFFFIFSIRTFLGITTDSLSLIELLMWGSLTYICFAAGYLYPQFKKKDERTQFIRQKGMYYSLFAVLIYFIALMLGSRFDILNTGITEIIQLLISLTIITIFSSWIILSKKY